MFSLTTNNLSFAYKDLNTIDHVNLQVKSGEVLVILGPNGIGKSTLINCLSGVFSKYQGSIKLDNEELKQIGSKELSHKLALVSQRVNINTNLSLFDYLLLGRSAFHSIFSQPNKDDEKLVDQVISRIGLENLKSTSLQNMSGGQKQLANIGRALVQEPKILIMDEPTSALDYKNQVNVLKLVKTFSNQGIAIVMSTHDPNQATMVADSVGLLVNNKTYRQGSTEEILSDKSLSELYQTPIISTFNEDLQRNVFGIEMG
ncbi:ABC transporter ATP-binding protein [Companilactobacillus keshanensis]|uniref:ABC transporter ATP-binding protein n=1 Tax=Companilactobacillus keshanensis TaxID=2486003 RepID=A0ABW4BS81_9LACO|nr:ABC transporter ATP-binding protein [Companilactobacillus keshanensis]